MEGSTRLPLQDRRSMAASSSHADVLAPGDRVEMVIEHTLNDVTSYMYVAIMCVASLFVATMFGEDECDTHAKL